MDRNYKIAKFNTKHHSKIQNPHSTKTANIMSKFLPGHILQGKKPEQTNEVQINLGLNCRCGDLCVATVSESVRSGQAF